MNTFLASLVLLVPFLTGLVATVAVHRWVRRDGYGRLVPPATHRDWSPGDLPSRPYATLR
jgi:hypothetical protein